MNAPSSACTRTNSSLTSQRITSAAWTVWSITAPPPARRLSPNHDPGYWPGFVARTARIRPSTPPAIASLSAITAGLLRTGNATPS